MAFKTNHFLSLVEFLLLYYYYNVLRKRSFKIKKNIKKKYAVRSRHMRVARYHYLLCRSILGTKRWRTVRKKHRRKRNIPPRATWKSFFCYSKKKTQHYREAGSRIRATKRLLNHNKGGVSSLSGLFVRVYNVRTRRFRVGRHFCFRSNILTPLLYIPYYVSSSSNLYGTLSNHYITLITKFLVKHIRRYKNKKRKSKVLRRVKQFFLLYYKAISFIRSTIRSRRSCYLLGFRNAYFSMCGLGGSFYIQNRDKYTYFKLLKDSKFLIKNTTGHVCVLNNVMSNSRSFIWGFFTFLFKFSYLFFLYNVLKKLYTSVASFFSESFFSFVLQMFVSSRKRNTLFFFNMFSSRQLRISFFKFLIGNDGSRLSFFLFRISSNASFFFVLWFFNLYKKLFFSLFFFSIKTDFVISFLISYNLCSVLPFLLRFATIFSYCQSFFLCVDKIRTFSFSVQSYLIFQYRIPSHMYNLCSNFFYLVMHFKLYRAHGGLLRFLRAKALNNLVYQIEHSFFFSSNVLHFISARFYYKSVPPITNAKMVCDVVVITMSLGLNLRSAFSKILNWQTHWQNYYNDNTVAFINRYKVNIGNFVYPLKGIRLDCSGPPYKARRTSRSQYHLWVSNELLTGKMPLSFVDLQIDYYQSVVIIRRSNIGVKVWLLFDAIV